MKWTKGLVDHRRLGVTACQGGDEMTTTATSVQVGGKEVGTEPAAIACAASPHTSIERIVVSTSFNARA